MSFGAGHWAGQGTGQQQDVPPAGLPPDSVAIAGRKEQDVTRAEEDFSPPPPAACEVPSSPRAPVAQFAPAPGPWPRLRLSGCDGREQVLGRARERDEMETDTSCQPEPARAGSDSLLLGVPAVLGGWGGLGKLHPFATSLSVQGVRGGAEAGAS